MIHDKHKIKAFFALIVATILIWKPTIVVLFPGFIYTDKLDRVFLSDGCVEYSQLTVFIFCLFEVLISCLLLKTYVFPFLLFSSNFHKSSEKKGKHANLNNGDGAIEAANYKNKTEEDTRINSFLPTTQKDTTDISLDHLIGVSVTSTEKNSGTIERSHGSPSTESIEDIESDSGNQVFHVGEILKIQTKPKDFCWDSLEPLKQRKLVGTLLKIIVRFCCCIQILCIVSPYLDLHNGLFSQFNIKQAYFDLVENYTLTPCGVGKFVSNIEDTAGMTLRDATCLRAWTFVRDNLMAVMVWELSFIPELSLEIWIHHLYVIFAVTLGSDPVLLGSRRDIQPLIDIIAFFLVLGATLIWVVELCAFRYHFNKSEPLRQARWMLVSLVLQAVLTVTLFFGFPLYAVYIHQESFGVGVSIMIVGLIFLLAALEVKVIVVKWSIVKHARRKVKVIST